MLTTIYLHGSLKEQFGPTFEFAAEAPWQIFRAMAVQLKGFRQAIAGGRFGVILGDLETGLELGAEELSFRIGKTKELHLLPIVAGAGGRAAGVVKIVLGVALLGFGIAGAALAAGSFASGLGATAFSVAGFGVTYGTIATVGAGLAITGVSGLLSSRPDVPKSGRTGSYDDREGANRPSFFFTGPQNRAGQGGAIPLVYGRVRTGSIVVSAGINTEVI